MLKKIVIKSLTRMCQCHQRFLYVNYVTERRQFTTVKFVISSIFSIKNERVEEYFNVFYAHNGAV
jgi:hypothetical protein